MTVSAGKRARSIRITRRAMAGMLWSCRRSGLWLAPPRYRGASSNMMPRCTLTLHKKRCDAGGCFQFPRVIDSSCGLRGALVRLPLRDGDPRSEPRGAGSQIWRADARYAIRGRCSSSRVRAPSGGGGVWRNAQTPITGEGELAQNRLTSAALPRQLDPLWASGHEDASGCRVVSDLRSCGSLATLIFVHQA